MSEIKKYIVLWYIAWISLALGFIAFLFFLKDVGLVRAIVFLLFFAIHSVCKRIYGNKLECDEKGYSYVQAMFFFKSCERVLKNANKRDIDEKTLRHVGKTFEYSAGFSKNELMTLYNDGKEVCFELKRKKGNK